MSNAYFIEEWELPQHVVLLCGDGHTWIAMDYRETNGNPSIIFIDVEVEDELFVLPLADSFEQFINGLFTYEE